MALNASASSGSNLGFGMEFYLIDNFSKVANRIKASMASLNQAAANQASNTINANRAAISQQRLLAASSQAQAAANRNNVAQAQAQGAQLRVQNQQQAAANQNAIAQQRILSSTAQAQAAQLRVQNQQVSAQQRQVNLSNRQAAAMQNFQVGYNQMMSGFSAIGGAAIFAAPIMYAIHMAGEFEKATVRLETLLKSKDKAMSFFNDLKTDALKLPNVEVLDLLKGVGDLIAGGEDSQVARGVMRDLANVVMATGGGQPQFQRAAFNLAQIRNNGFASMRDIREFSTANIPLISLLKKQGIDVGKTKATYEQIIKVLGDYAKENNVAEKMLNSISGQTAMFKENMKYLFADMGEALKPFYVPLMKYLNGTINSLREFTGSAFGKFVLRGAMLVLIFATLTTFAYGLFKIFGGLKIMFMSMSGAIGHLAKSYGGLIPMVRTFAITLVGLYAVGKLLTSGSSFLIGLGLLLAYVLGPIGWVTAAIVMLSAGFKEWQNFMNGGTSIGTFGKIAGVLQGVWEMMNNITDSGWTMNAALVKKLDDAGILGIVQTIGNFIFVVREFFKGLWEGFILPASRGFGAISKAMSFVDSLFGKQQGSLGRIITSMETWKKVGQAIGVVFGIVFGLIELGVSGIVFVIGLVTKAFATFYDYIQGIQEYWDRLLGGQINFGGSTFGYGQGQEGGGMFGYGQGSQSTSYTPSDYMKDNGSDMRETQAVQLQGAMSAINIQQSPQQILQDQNINVFLDGDLMYSKMKDKGAFEQARYG